MTDYDKVVETLSNRLAGQQGCLEESKAYRESTYRLKTIGLGTPPEMRYFRTHVGWPGLYLRALEERLDVEGFRVDGQSDGVEELWKWWQDNNLDEESGLAHMDAFTYGRSYITISAPMPEDNIDSPIIRLESPLSMIAEIDPRTRKLTKALRLYKTDPTTGPEGSNIADAATLFLPDQTVYLRRSSGPIHQWVTDGPPVSHGLGVVPVVPLTNRHTLSDLYGTSEITPELRTLTDAAERTLMNLQSASELMAVPLRVFMGVSREDLVGDGANASVHEAYHARIIALKNKDSKAFEFSAADLRNFTEELSELAKHVASYTGLPPQYLSFSSDNPASAEAILASESRLVKKCERKAKMFGGSWEETMRIATKVMGTKVPEEYNRLETVWRDPSTPTHAAMADATTKLYNQGNGLIPKEQGRRDLGYTQVERDNMKEWDKEERQSILTDLYNQTKAVADASPTPAPAASKPAAKVGGSAK